MTAPLRRGLLALVGSGFSLGASANTLADCRAERDGAARLRCYDALPLAPASAPAGAGTDEVLAQWQGNGALMPRPFRAAGPWELQWSSAGLFQAWIVAPDGRAGQVIANQAGGGPGSSYIRRSGEFALWLSASGPWQARVVAVR